MQTTRRREQELAEIDELTQSSRSTSGWTNRSSRTCAAASARTRFPDQIEGDRVGRRHPDRLPARAGRVLARTATTGVGAGGPPQRVRALPHPDRRAVDPLHPRPVAPPGRPSAAPHPRLAGLGRRVPRRDSAAHRSPGLRRSGGRCVPRDRAVAPGLRVLGAAAHPRLGRATDRRGVHRAHGPPRLSRATARRAATGAPR